jgi:uncharacterized protein
MRRNSRAAALIPPAYASYALVGTLLAVSVGTVLRMPLLIQLPCLGFLGVAWAARAPELLPAASLAVFTYVGAQFFPDFVWSLPSLGFLLPLLLAGLLSLPSEGARAAWGWLRKGKADFPTILLALTTSLLAAAALMLWAFWTDNLGAGAAVLRDYQGVPRWFLFLVGVPVFAMLNAAAEEGIFRGVFLGALLARFPRDPRLALSVQALAFAAAHYWAGFPNGRLGLLMTFIYACMLGQLRLRSRGMLVPFLTHFSADVVIGYLLILLAHRG